MWSFQSTQKRPLVQWGIYAVFLEKLFRLYPREHIYVSNLHVWSKDRAGSLERLFYFLGVGESISETLGQFDWPNHCE